MSRLSIPASLLSVVVAVVAAGCGSGAPGGGTQTLLAGTSEALAAAHSFRITIDGTGSAKGQSPSTLHGEGVVDWTADSADIRITGLDQPSRLIVADGSLYLHRNAALTPTPTKREWLRVPIGNQSVLGGLDPLGDPLTTLSSLAKHLRGITTLGDSQVEGVSTTELKGTVSGLGKADGAATATVWIDHQHRIRQLHLVATGDGKAEITERFSDFGTPVHVDAPPADEVIDFDKLLNQQLAKIPASDFPSPHAGMHLPSHPAVLPQPTGSWAVRASGLSDGISWQLETTVATHHGECLATITTPALGQISSDHAADGSGTDGSTPPLDYRGLPANCGPATKQYDHGLTDPIVQVLDADNLAQSGSGRHYVSGIASGQVASLVAQLSDGTTAPVTLHDGVFFSTWTGHRRLAAMTFDYPPDPLVTCTADTGSGYDVGDLTCG